MEKLKVLVVEDNPLNMKLVRTLLELGKLQIIEAETAQKGINLAKEIIPDLILMDIQLPDMDGLSAVRVIRQTESTSHIPIVALTAYAMQSDEERALNAGCTGYITKPVKTKSFLNKINKYINQDVKEHSDNQTQIRDHRNKILIVDDEPLDVKLLEASLSREDYRVFSAHDGPTAVEKVETIQPDLILLDIMMPSIDGYEVTRRLKTSAKTRDIPIILITSLTGIDDKNKGMQAGADEFLNKPVNTTELLARVKSLIRLKKYQEQLKSRNKSEVSFVKSTQSIASSKPEKEMPVVLLVEDNENDLRLLRAHLNGQSYQMKYVRTGEEALSFCLKHKTDLLILDVILPGINGFGVCRQLKNNDATRKIQILMVTSLNDLESRIKGIEFGADDFLIKPIHKDEFIVRVRALLRKKSYLDMLSKKYEPALYAAITDKLTCLYNREYLNHFLDYEIKRCNRQNQTMGLVMLEIEDFKAVNDTYGHLTGDRILEKFGTLIKNQIREIDVAARYGGEKFAVVLTYVNQAQAEGIAERIKKTVSAFDFFNQQKGPALKMTISLGIGLYPEHAKTVAGLVEKADKALYCAKKDGKNIVRKYS
jgi:two-component system, cell cycle response regulator